jgi:5-deoxy-glucuronate isomerase
LNGRASALKEGTFPDGGMPPGHAEYIFTVLVGKHRLSLIQNFKEAYWHPMGRIPGIAGMREKFK